MTDAATIRKLERLALQMRFDLVEMIGQGKFGHLGGSSSLAEIAACLYFHAMRFDPKNLKDPDRDRFLLSKGHCVLIQYAAMAEMGVIPREELKKRPIFSDVCTPISPLRYDRGEAEALVVLSRAGIPMVQLSMGIAGQVTPVTVAGSLGFATPLGYQTHMMVYSPGGYRFTDYFRIGIPLNLLLALVTVGLAPLIWPF